MPVGSKGVEMERHAAFADLKIEPHRGVYDAPRAAALAGVPQSTLHLWARRGFFRPSISPEPRTRLWSWADLLTLRAIDWFRKGQGTGKRVPIRIIGQALDELLKQGMSREELSRVVAVSDDGRLYFRLDHRPVRADPGQQAAFTNVLHLVQPYELAPNLLEPRPLLRIIPGKLHGEPHILDTRIPSATINALYEAGYDVDTLQQMYPDASSAALHEAIEFERSLQHERVA
jgi:uncharacterized protein (DUF433 family)/DNA-binding transcriptional MerR regulator